MFAYSIVIVYSILATSVCSYKIPEPTIERFSSGGFRISIPDEPRMQFFAIHANVNDPIKVYESGTIEGEVTHSHDNRWTFEEKKITLRKQDVLHYWIYVQADGLSYTRVDNNTSGLTSKLQSGEIPDCEHSITAVRGKLAACKNRLVFEVKFEQNIDIQNSNTSLLREIMLPLNPDYEFCAYRELQNSLKFEDGNMNIVPLITDDVYGENITLFGRLDLSDTCTSSLPLECKRKAVGYSILPPVISARLTTKESFYFRYGKIEIRAKFPKGDWLYPELRLEPKQHIYGFGYSSGQVILGMTRGNEHLANISNSDKTQYGSTRLEFGLRTGSTGNIREDKITKRQSLVTWNSDFHVYTTIWNEDGFRFQVDGEDVGRIKPAVWLNSDKAAENYKQSNNRMAPYDSEFYITVGLGVGGVRVFPDGTISGRNPKPWRNPEAKAMLNFWKAKEQWLPTWRTRNNNKDSHLQLNYIRVWTI